MKENLRKCTKCGCSPAEDPNIMLHRFPKPGRTNSLRCEMWAKFCFPHDSWFSPQLQNQLYSKHLMLCSRHFKESSFIDNSGKKLVKSAVPDEECDKPPAIPSTSVTDTATTGNTMKCNIPFCMRSFKTSGDSCGISFFNFPEDPNVRKEWVKALGIRNWEAKRYYIICSEHFKEESLYETKHGRKLLYPDALPIKCLNPDAPAALMICRICLTVDSNMQDIGKFSEMFNHITGLLTADSESCRLPQQLCWECAARLKSAASLRQKALSSDAILRALLKPDTFIKIRDIKTINRKSYGLKTSLVQKLIDSEHYDVKIQDTFIDTDHIKTKYDLEEGIPELLENDAENEEINNLNENYSVECNTKTNIMSLEKNPEILGNPIAIEVQNDDEENDLKFMMLQNDNFNNTTEELIIQNNDKVTEEKEMSDEDMFEEYVYSVGDTTEKVGESDIPKEMSKIVHEENLGKSEIGVQNVKKARQNKTVARVVKTRARKMVNSRAGLGQSKINNEDISRYENLFDITDLTFEQQREEIFKRQEHQSYKNAPYKCTVCFTGFKDKPVFDRHTLKHTDIYGKFECTICKIRKKKSSMLNRHLVVLHSREYKCVECDFVTRHCEGARAHVKYHKGKRYQCKQCPLVFDKCTTYFGHVRLYHVHSNVCEYCGYTFVSQRGVKNHKIFVHKLEKNLECKGPYCKECDVTFLSKDAYNKHLRLSSKHLKDESDPSRIRNEPPHVPRTQPVIGKHDPVTCEQCGVKLQNYRSYSHHFLSLHPGLNRTQFPDTTPLICEHCGKVFASVTGLLAHKWVHTGKKMYQCDHCDKSFAHKVGLTAHLNSVTEGQPRHQCSECGKAYVNLNNLQRHQLIHTGLKAFQCDFCSKKFESNSKLNEHKRHTHYKIPWPRKVKRKDVNKI